MDITKLTNRQFHLYSIERAQTLKRAERELVEIMIGVDKRKLYLDFGLRSSFEYAVKELKLSGSVSYALKAVSRKAAEIPEFRISIHQGKISLSKGKSMTAALTKENAAEFVKKAETITCRELEKEVARLNPKKGKPERLKYISDTQLSLNTTLEEADAKDFRRIQDLESQRTGKACNIEETLKGMMAFYLKHKDPVKKAERAATPATVTATAAAPKNAPPKIPSTWKKSRNIPAKVRHAVNLRDQSQCTHKNEDGTRCDSRRWVDHHHIVPVWVGGENTSENMTTLCSAHHRREHEVFG